MCTWGAPRYARAVDSPKRESPAAQLQAVRRPGPSPGGVLKPATGILLGALVLAASRPLLAQGQPDSTLCNVPISGHPNESWRLVRGEGFTFCVPMSWRPSGRASSSADAKTWRGHGASITWGRGEPRPGAPGTGTGPRGTAVGRIPAEQLMGFERSQDRKVEEIGGRAAEVWHTEDRGNHYTGAQWRNPDFFIYGEAKAPAVADLQLTIYRTTRATAPPTR